MKRIELLFPELCNIYGESYNVEYLKRSNPENIEVISTNHKEQPHTNILTLKYNVSQDYHTKQRTSPPI